MAGVLLFGVDNEGGVDLHRRHRREHYDIVMVQWRRAIRHDETTSWA